MSGVNASPRDFPMGTKNLQYCSSMISPGRGSTMSSGPKGYSIPFVIHQT